MRYIKDNLIFETPIFAVKDGEEVELFDEQLRRLGYVPEEEVIMKQRAEIANKSYATVDKLQILLNSIEVQAPQGSTYEDDVIKDLPFKLGQKWVPVVNGNTISYQLVQDPDALGIESRPFIFFDGEENQLYPNAFYIHGGIKFVYVGIDIKSVVSWEECSEDMETWD